MGREGSKPITRKPKDLLLSEVSSDESLDVLPSTSKTRKQLVRSCKEKKPAAIDSSSEENCDTIAGDSKKRKKILDDSSFEEYLPPKTRQKMEKMKKIKQPNASYFMGQIDEGQLESIRVNQLDHGESIENEDFHVLQTHGQDASDDEADEIPDIDTSLDEVCSKAFSYLSNNTFISG